MRDGPDVACRASRRLLAFGRLDDIFACWPRKFRRFQGETARDVTATVWHAHILADGERTLKLEMPSWLPPRIKLQMYDVEGAEEVRVSGRGDREQRVNHRKSFWQRLLAAPV